MEYLRPRARLSHLPPRIADQRWAWPLPASAAGNLDHSIESILFEPHLPKWHHHRHQIGLGPRQIGRDRIIRIIRGLDQDLSVHEDAVFGPESQIRGAGHREGTRLPHGTQDSRSEMSKVADPQQDLACWSPTTSSAGGDRHRIHGSPRRLDPTFGIQIQGVAKWRDDHDLALTLTRSQTIPSTATQNRSPQEARTVRSRKRDTLTMGCEQPLRQTRHPALGAR